MIILTLDGKHQVLAKYSNSVLISKRTTSEGNVLDYCGPASFQFQFYLKGTMCEFTSAVPRYKYIQHK